jgi:hypothetical protein
MPEDQVVDGPPSPTGNPTPNPGGDPQPCVEEPAKPEEEDEE